jgi:hypothetical protein
MPRGFSATVVLVVAFIGVFNSPVQAQTADGLRVMSQCIKRVHAILGEDANIFHREGVSVNRGYFLHQDLTSKQKSREVLRLNLIHKDTFYAVDYPVPAGRDSQGREQSSYLWTAHQMRVEIPSESEPQQFCVSFVANFIVADELKRFDASPPSQCADWTLVVAQLQTGTERRSSLRSMKRRLTSELAVILRWAQRLMSNLPSFTVHTRHLRILEQVRSTDWTVCLGATPEIDNSVSALIAFQQAQVRLVSPPRSTR